MFRVQSRHSTRETFAFSDLMRNLRSYGPSRCQIQHLKKHRPAGHAEFSGEGSYESAVKHCSQLLLARLGDVVQDNSKPEQAADEAQARRARSLWNYSVEAGAQRGKHGHKRCPARVVRYLKPSQSMQRLRPKKP